MWVVGGGGQLGNFRDEFPSLRFGTQPDENIRGTIYYYCACMNDGGDCYLIISQIITPFLV